MPLNTKTLQLVNFTRYYQTDGTCNSIANPLFGARGSPMIRLFEDGFEDGIDTIAPMRLAETARSDSLSANDIKGLIDQKVPEVNSDMSTAVGQLLTHELMKTKKIQLGSDKRKGGFNCCNQKCAENNTYCMPVDVKSSDPCFGNSVNCLNYIKSLKSLNNCKLDSTALPINFHTPVFDAELIYNERSLKHLKETGKFNVENFEQMKDILVGFDDRSMQLPGLMIYLNFFTRFHNIVFDEFNKFRGFLGKDVLAAEARKLTTAVYQKIYLDYLLTLLRKFITET